MKTLSLVTAALALVVAIAAAIVEIDRTNMPPVQTDQQHVGSGSSIALYDNNGNSGATSTANGTLIPALFLTTGAATSTITIPVQNGSNIDVNFWVKASSTATAVQWQYMCSNNGIDFYTFDTNSTATNIVTHNGGARYDTWVPGTTSAGGRTYSLTTIGCKWLQVQYGVAAANGYVYLQLAVKNAIAN